MYENYGIDDGDGDFAEDFGTSMTAGLTDLGLPAMGFTAFLGTEVAEYKMDKYIGAGPDGARWGGRFKNPGIGDMFGIRPGWRAGINVGSKLRMGKASKLLGLGGAAGGLALSMLPLMAVDAAVGYAQENITAGAESYYGANRMMNQLSSFAGSGFGQQSVLGGGMGEASIESWAGGAGASQVRGLGESTGLGISGVAQMAGHLTSQGMIDGFDSPEQFLSQFREKLQQVKQLSETLDVTLEEATQVMSTLNKAGISGDRQASMAGYAGTVSSLTGQSLNTVMRAGLSGSATATQMGLSADVGFETGASTLSSTAVMSRLGILDERLVERAGGVEGLSAQMTQASLQISSSYGAQNLMARMVNKEGSGFDAERMGEVFAGDRPGRRRLDPYAIADMQEEFQENQEALITGQISRLRARHDDDRDFHRAQYRFMAEMGINDPQMQQAYLQQMRAQPMMNVLEASQAGRNRLQTQQQQGGSSGILGNITAGVLDSVGVDYDELSQDIDRYFGEPFRRFGERFARTMEDLGESISEFFVGPTQGGVDPLDLSTQDIEDYSLRHWQGNRTEAFTIGELEDMRTSMEQIQETDTRGLMSRIGLSSTDDRQSAQILRQFESGVLDPDDYGVMFYQAEGNVGLAERLVADTTELLGMPVRAAMGENLYTDHYLANYASNQSTDPSIFGSNLLNQAPVTNEEGRGIYMTAEDREQLVVDSMTAGASGNTRDMRRWNRRMETYGEDMIDEVTTAYDRRGVEGARDVVGRQLGYTSETRSSRRARQTVNAVLAQTDAFSEIAEEASLPAGGGINYEEGIAAISRQYVHEASQQWSGAQRQRTEFVSTSPSMYDMTFTEGRRVAVTSDIFDEERHDEMAEALEGAESREYLEMMSTMAHVQQVTGADMGMISDRLQGRLVGGTNPFTGQTVGDSETLNLAAWAESHTDAQATARMGELLFPEGEGDAEQQALRFLFGGLNPTDEEDVERVQDFVTGRGLSGEIISEFQDLSRHSHEDPGEESDWGTLVRSTRAAGASVVSSELDRAIGGNLEHALSLDVLHGLEATDIEAARARVLREQSSGIVGSILHDVDARSTGDLANESVRSLVNMLESSHENPMSVASLAEDQVHWDAIRAQERVRVEESYRRDNNLLSGDTLTEDQLSEINEEVEETITSRQDRVRGMEGNLELGQAFYAIGARMAAGGLDAEERASVRALGSQGAELISLSEEVGDGDAQAIQNLLENSSFGQAGIRAVARSYLGEGVEEDELMEGLAELMAEGERGGRSAFADLMGSAMSSGYLSTDLQNEKTEEMRARRQDEHLEAISNNTQVLTDVVGGSGDRRLRVTVGQISEDNS